MLFVPSVQYPVRATHLTVVALPQVIGQVVLDVVGKLLLILEVQLKYFHEARDEDGLEVAVRERFDITGGLHHGVDSISEVHVHVGAHQISFTCGTHTHTSVPKLLIHLQ